MAQVLERATADAEHGARHAMKASATHDVRRTSLDGAVEAGAVQRRGVRCLLMHGFNGELVDMWELEGHLQRLGYSTSNLLLPGHGTSVRDFAAHGWNDWYAHVERETRHALDHGERVLLIGHSMGAAVSLALAAAEPRVAGVAALCPPLQLSPMAQRFIRTLGRVMPYIPSWREDIRDRRGARARYTRNAYSWTAVAPIESLMTALPELHRALPQVQCPALVVCARNDHVVPLRDGLETFQLLGTEEKDLLVLRHSYHAVTKDVERHLVFDRVLRFCERVDAAAGRGD
jgi:carboxylesterase